MCEKMNVYLIENNKIKRLNKDDSWFENIFLPSINQDKALIKNSKDEYWKKIRNILLGKEKNNNIKIHSYEKLKFCLFKYKNKILIFGLGEEKSDTLKNLQSEIIKEEINSYIYLDKKIVKPTEITDDIINNIKTLNYRELNLEQSKVLTSVIKNTLKEVKKDGLNREVAFAYDLNGYRNHNGQWLFKTTGKIDTDYIDLGSSSDINHILMEKRIQKIVVISHNHPNNRIISLQDIKTFCNESNLKLIVAVTNSGKISYIVKENFNFDKYIEISRALLKNLSEKDYNLNQKEEDDLFLKELLNKSSEFGVYFFKEG